MNFSNLEHSRLTAGQLLEWGRTRAWGTKMADCPQEPEWHREGDVWRHTELVCEALSQLDEWQHLGTLPRNILLLAALLHDCAKPAVSKIEDGRIRTNKHGVVGAYMARKILRDAGTPLEIRERIVNLVRYHNKPTNIFRQDSGLSVEAETAALSWRVELPLAIILAKADTLGALADDQADRMERVEMLKLQALELGCFDTPFRPHEDHARFLFFREGMKWHDYKGGFKPFENFCCTVTMMSGLPGAGKDTWIQAKRPGTPVVGLDGIRREMKVGWMDNQGQVIQAAKKRIKEYMASGIDFIFNATNTVWRWRRNYVSLFAQYGAKIEIVYIEPGWPELLNQNKNRPAPVPEKVLHAKYDTLDIPTITECHRVTYI